MFSEILLDTYVAPINQFQFVNEGSIKALYKTTHIYVATLLMKY